MSYLDKLDLEKYEIKKPDYDLAEREYVPMADSTYEPSRYEEVKGVWKSKKHTKGIFKKKAVRLMFAGDITCFENQFAQAQKGRDYDFRYEFEKIGPVFAQSDLAIGNLETMIFPEAPYRTEKYVSEMQYHCNAPIEFLEGVRTAGFDVLTNANNHAMDTGAIGISETIDYVEKFGFIQTGTFDREKKHYEVIDVDGIKVGIVAFGTEFNNKRENLTDEGVEFLLNSYTPERAEKLYKMAKNDGAEAVFMCIHWGKENKLVENQEQRDIALEIAEMGYDCIIGSHPHVLQPFHIIEAGDRRVPVFYSMGNFVSHNANNPKGRTIIACVDLEKNKKEISINCSYIPVFTSNNYGKKKFVVLPLPKEPREERNKERLELIKDVMGSEIEIADGVVYEEYTENKTLPIPKPKPKKPDLEKAVFPIKYEESRFVFEINEDSAVITGMSIFASNLSYSMPGKVLGIPVTGVTAGAFEGNRTMKKMNFSKAVKKLPDGVCRNCRELEGFQMGRLTSEIGYEAFAGCVKLWSAVMRGKVKKIGGRAFAGCTGLRSVKIPASVIEIADDAFEGCSNAIVYCEKESYAEQYAKEHGMKYINMVFE